MKALCIIFIVMHCIVGVALTNEQVVEFDCSMPIILFPLIHEIRNIAAGGEQGMTSRQDNAVRTSFEIGRFLPQESDQLDYDNFITVTCPMVESTFQLFIKDNIVMKIVQMNPDGAISTYEQNIAGGPFIPVPRSRQNNPTILLLALRSAYCPD